MFFSLSTLAARLENDASLVHGAAVGQIPVFTQSLVTLTFGIGIGFYYSWRMTLVLLAVLPVSILASLSEMMAVSGGYANKVLRGVMR